VTKAYADAIAQGLSVKPSVQEATAAALPANTYSNGASGVGATLTAVLAGVLTVDGIAVALGDRVLVQNEAAPANNGIYTVTTLGTVGVAYILTRAVDMNTAASVPGAFAFTEQGTANAAAGFTVASEGPFTIGTTAITWTQFSGAGEITAGTGLSKSGNTLSLITPVAAGNLPTGTTSTKGALQLDGTATDIQPAGTQAAGSVGMPPDAGHVHPSWELTPADLGVVGWTCNPARSPTTVQIPTSRAGVLLLWTLRIPVAGTVTNINYTIDAPGAGLSNCFLGLYTMAGALITNSGTADQSTNFGASAANHAAALGTPYSAPAGLIRIGMVIGAMSGAPTFTSAGSFVASAFLGLGVTTPANYPCANTGSGFTALPASFTPSGLATNLAPAPPVFVLN
jgi:hypothetical protein